MESMSPLLKTKLNQRELNNNSEIKISQRVDLSQKPDTVELTANNKDKSKKVFKIAAIIASALAVVAGGFVLARKGVFGQNLKSGADKLWSNITSIFKKAPEKAQIEPKPQVESPKPAENIKKFISNGSEIENVKLEEGKAVLADGSMFSGTMETVTKSGKKVAIDYENGFMTKSIVNDNLLKTYEAPTRSLDRTKGTLIREFDESGKAIKQSYHFLNDKGKISKIMAQNITFDSRGYENGYYDVLELSPNGKKIAQYQTRPDFRLENGKIFNEDGSVKKEIQNLGSEYRETTPLDDGSKVEKIGSGYSIKDLNEQIATKEISNPNEIRFIDKDGNFERRYSVNQSGGEARLEINPDDRYNQIVMKVPYTTKLRGQNESLSDNFASVKLIRDVEGDEGQMQALTILDDAIKNRKINTETATRGFTKDELLSTISELERGIKVAEDNKMFYLVNKNGCEVSYERFRNYIQKLKEFADSM